MDYLHLENEFLNKDILKHTVKNFLPRSASYNLTNDPKFSNMNILNNEIELNSAELFSDGLIKNQDKTEFASILDKTNANNTSDHSKSPMFESIESVDIPKKKTVLGYPLLCFTYVASVYSLFAYGATSLLSIVQLMTYNSPKFLPLYLLLTGYLMITLISFLLIVAIQKENLNLILFWIISLSVFILPEIGLNIVLAENSFNWLETTQGFYTLIALVIRVTIDLPCIAIVLAYHVNRTRRNSYLQKMIKPLKRDIMSGKVLKSYNNLDLPTNKYPVVDTMPKPEEANSIEVQDVSIKSRNLSYPDEIAMNVLETAPNQSLDKNSNSNRNSYLNNTQNVFEYKFFPHTNYDILVRPSRNGDFTQRFVNVDNIEFCQRPDLKSFEKEKKRHLSLEQKRTDLPNEIYSFNSLKSRNAKPNLKYRQSLALNTQVNADYDSVEQNLNFFDETSIPIELESLKKSTIREKKINLFNFNNTLPFTAQKEIRKKYENMINKGQKLNLTSHQIYLPPPSSLGPGPYYKKNSQIINEKEHTDLNKNASYIKSPECNCINIAACDKDKINEFLHSNECELFKNSFDKTISQASMHLSNIELFNQRKVF